MTKNVIFQGNDTQIFEILKKNNIKAISIDQVRETSIIKKNSVFIQCGKLKNENNKESLDHIRWAKEKCLITIYISEKHTTLDIKKYYELGFSFVLKKTSNMKDLLTLLEDSKSNIPRILKSKSKEYNNAIEIIYKHLSNSNSPVLIKGETGVGKTFIVKNLIQALFPDKSFINKNLSEFSEDVLESELFGHKKGSYTGAINDREGIFERSNGGFLFLDEIATLPLHTQQKVLKVIEEQEVTPLGADKSIQLSFQLITATCDNLEELVNEGLFREDLYYRLAGSSITIPPLQDRLEELENIIHSLQTDQTIQLAFTDEAFLILKNHNWKGNIRQLRSVLNQLRVTGHSYITVDDLIRNLPLNQKSPLLTSSQKSRIKSIGLPEFIKKIEQEVFKENFSSLNGKTNKVCEHLKISKSVFYRLNQAI